jgi:hypothetical protein
MLLNRDWLERGPFKRPEKLLRLGYIMTEVFHQLGPSFNDRLQVCGLEFQQEPARKNAISSQFFVMGHSQNQKIKTHERIVRIAAKRFREKGIDGVAIADLMKEVGAAPPYR